MDLAAWWQARRWPALLELIDQLPSSSRLNEAIQNDPDQAALIAFARTFREADQDEEEEEPWAPRVSEYDLHAQLLANLTETVGAVLTVLTGKTVPGLPSPRTEVQRMAEELDRLHDQRTGAKFGFTAEDYQ